MSSNRNINTGYVSQEGWPRDDWARLADHLFRRRIELDPRYATFKVFIEERGVPSLYRTAWDVEHAVSKGRTNITRGTLITKIDPLYGYEPGGCEAILNGMEPVSLPGTPGAPPRPRARHGRGGGEPSAADMSPEELAAKFVEFLEWDRARKEGRSERSA